MTTITKSKKTIQFAAIAALALGAPLEGGNFQGLITLKDGTHAAVVLLVDKPAKRLKHAAAKKWAESVDGVLPTRPVAALLYANAKIEFEPDWYWTADTLDSDTGDKDDASCAWGCYFGNGYQVYSDTSVERAARAVRLIHLEV